MMRYKLFLLTLLSLLMMACGGGLNSSSLEEKALSNTSGSLTIKGEAWADNWFALYLGEELLLEDSVSITTERSFNAEAFTFKADYPLHLNFILKDFKENDTGLEYIGANNQQMGDGGFIAQFTDTGTGEVIAVSNSDFRCTVIHQAPLDKSCENESNPMAGEGVCDFVALDEPAGWKSADFDDSAWQNATVHSSADVSPKQGYEQITWDGNAQLIWGSDLETDNTVLCRVTVEGPQVIDYQFLMRYRRYYNTAVIIMTAKEEESDAVIGFELGADDYVIDLTWKKRGVVGARQAVQH